MRRALATGLTALLTLLPAAAEAGAPGAGTARSGAAATAAAPTGQRHVALTRWDSARQWRRGTGAGTVVADGRLTFGSSVAALRRAGRTYDVARWTSPWVAPGFAFTELVASWSAATPADSWVEVRVRGAAADGRRTSFDVLARWAAGDRFLRRHSVSRQPDDGTSVAVDTWRTSGLASYQLQVRLVRRAGTAARPSLDLAAAMTSRLPAAAGRTSRPGVARGTVLPVPRYSQMAHRGHYPRWGGGGEAWCSPTSTAMVLGYYDALPAARQHAWVPEGHVDPWVDHAARGTFDHAYDGTGNWPFNTAYAAPRAGKAFVTRLRHLRDAERLVAAGIPVVVSVAFDRGELDNAPIRATDGHLLVVVGFTSAGDVVVNDPASPTRRGVRRTYDRGQLERLWLEASGGLAYVVHDEAHPLPSPATAPAW